MYEDVFKIVSERLPDFKPDYIITDFEIGAINAATKYFPDAIMHGCFFHLCQSVWRHVQNVGLQKRYVSDAQFALGIRSLLALAFVPPEDIPSKFEELCATKFWSEDNGDVDCSKVQDLLSYFESTYIGVATRTRKKRATVSFPPALWSVYHIVLLGTTFISSIVYE